LGGDDSIRRDQKRSHPEKIRWNVSILRDWEKSHHERARQDDSIPRTGRYHIVKEFGGMTAF